MLLSVSTETLYDPQVVAQFCTKYGVDAAIFQDYDSEVYNLQAMKYSWTMHFQQRFWKANVGNLTAATLDTVAYMDTIKDRFKKDTSSYDLQEMERCWELVMSE